MNLCLPTGEGAWYFVDTANVDPHDVHVAKYEMDDSDVFRDFPGIDESSSFGRELIQVRESFVKNPWFHSIHET